jgi:hypothetical protein
VVEQRRRWVGQTLMVLFGLATIVAYVLVAGVINAQAPTGPYVGWVAVLQPSGNALPEQIELRVDALEPGAPGDHPALGYTILVCGDRPFQGVLLIGGQARLDRTEVADEHVFPGTDTRGDVDLQLENLSNVTIGQGANSWDLGAVQLLRVSIDALVPCVSASSDRGLQVGTSNSVAGVAKGPVQHTGAFLGLPGPRSSQVWPLVGGFPGVASKNYGEFQGIHGLSGAWIVPPGLHKRVSVGSLAARATVEVAVPPLADTSQITWNSYERLQPALRLSDSDAMAALQQGLVAAGIGLGIGGSVLASLLFELTRPKRFTTSPAVSVRSTDTVREAVTRSLNKHNRRATPVSVLLTVGIAVIAYLLGRSRR